MSAMRGSSGLGSAISSWMEVSSVAMLREGLHAPFEETGRETQVSGEQLARGLPGETSGLGASKRSPPTSRLRTCSA